MDWKHQTVTAEEVVSHLQSGMTLFVHGCAATPQTLLDAMVERKDLTRMRLVHLHLEGDLKFIRPENSHRFRSLSLFSDAALRGPIAEGRADFVPVFLSDIPHLFETGGTVPLDAVLIQVSPPDQHGICSLGTSVDAARAARRLNQRGQHAERRRFACAVGAQEAGDLTVARGEAHVRHGDFVRLALHHKALGKIARFNHVVLPFLRARCSVRHPP